MTLPPTPTAGVLPDATTNALPGAVPGSGRHSGRTSPQSSPAPSSTDREDCTARGRRSDRGDRDDGAADETVSLRPRDGESWQGGAAVASATAEGDAGGVGAAAFAPVG